MDELRVTHLPAWIPDANASASNTSARSLQLRSVNSLSSSSHTLPDPLQPNRIPLIASVSSTSLPYGTRYNSGAAMSTSIAIPKRRKASRTGKEPAVPYEPTFSSSSSSSNFSSPRTPGTAPTPLAAITASSTPEASTAATPSVDRQTARRSSYLSKSIEKAEYMVVNVGSPEAPRLVSNIATRPMRSTLDDSANDVREQISCVKSSQGFDWNQGKLSAVCIVSAKPLILALSRNVPSLLR